MGFTVLLYTILVTNTLLAAGVYVRNRKARLNQYFAAVTCFLNLWITVNYLENEPGLVGGQIVDVFLRLDFVFAIFFFYYWFRFCAEFAGVRKIRKAIDWSGLMLFIAGVFITPFCMVGDLILRDIHFENGVIAFTDGPLWILYAIYLLITCFGGLLFLFIGRRHALRVNDAQKKGQINVILLGFTVSMAIAMFINLFLQTFIDISLELSRLGLVGLSALVVAMAYAIVKQRFLEVRILVARTLTFGVLIAVFIALYVAVLFLGMAKLTHSEITTARLIFETLFTTVAVLSFHPIYRFVARVTDGILFKHRYDESDLLLQLSNALSSTIHLDEMAQHALDILLEEMRITHGALLVMQDGQVIFSHGHGMKMTKAVEKELRGLFVKRTRIRRKAYHLDELKEGKIKRQLRARDLSFVLPMFADHSLEAILALGGKATGEPYYERDIDVLQISGPQSAIAIQNAKAYREIQAFNEELEDRVERRTKQLEASQKRELEKAKDVSRLKDEFVFVAAHELRSPTLAIRGFVELIEDSMKKMPKDVKENIHAISMASDHLTQLVNDLLDVAREDAGTTKITVSAIDFMPILEYVVKEQGVLAKQKDVKIVLIADDLPMIIADKDKVKEVTTNLINNAIKYNREGGTITVRAKMKRSKLQVDVEDTGYGIPKKEQAKIFGKFFRAGGQATKGVLGTGLGLFITKMLVEKMGGEIWFESVEGEGTTFSYTLKKASKKDIAKAQKDNAAA